MGDLTIYIFKSSIYLILFYLLFKVMLSRETFYRFNRIALASFLIASFITPFIRLSLKPESNQFVKLHDVNPIEGWHSVVESTPESADNLGQFLLIIVLIYSLGFLITALKTVISFIMMIVMINSHNLERLNISNGVKLIIHQKKIPPFSWFKYIVISKKDYEEGGREILCHELAHISKMHSADIILAEVVKIVHWFNPAAYLLKQELRNIHEYQADEEVIKSGTNITQYQLLLIKKAVGDRLYTMANSLNHSKLKNRITMISKKPSKKIAALKVFFALPLIMFTVAIFATARANSILEPVSRAKFTNYFQSKDTVKINTSKNVKIILNTKDTTKTKRPVIIVDGKKLSDSVNIDSIDPLTVESVKVIRNKVASDSSVIDADSGVIYLTLKKPQLYKDSSVAVVNIKTQQIKRGMGDTDSRKILYIVNGKVQEGDFAVNSIDPGNISSITVLKDSKAAELYGESGKEGVILITVKDTLRVIQGASRIVKSESSKLIYRFDGKTLDIEGLSDRTLNTLEGILQKNLKTNESNSGVIVNIRMIKDSNADLIEKIKSILSNYNLGRVNITPLD